MGLIPRGGWQKRQLTQIRCVVEGVRALLVQHEAVDRDGVRVRFLGFGATSLDVDVHAYVIADDWNGFLETQEGLLFGIMEIVQEAGAKIAIPSQITYIAPNPVAEPSTPRTPEAT